MSRWCLFPGSFQDAKADSGEMIPATIWSFCEPATAIICACLPAISTMFRRSKQDGSTARTWYGTSSSARRSEKTSSSMARSRGDTLSRIEQPDETDYLARARGPSEGSESLDPEFPMNAIAVRHDVSVV